MDEVAAELLCSPAKVSRIETAGRSVQARDVRDLCRFYGVSEAEQSELMAIAAEARRRGWWQDYSSLGEQIQTYIGLESAAQHLWEVQTVVLPGLLQTPDFTRALLTHVRPPGFWEDGVVDEIVEVRGRRQKRLHDGQIQLYALVDELAFTRVIGNPETMAAQVAHLAVMSTLDNVHLQLLPLAGGAHAGLDGSFQILRSDSDGVNDILYTEGQFGDQIIDRRDRVRHAFDVHQHLSADVALSPTDTTIWLQEHHERYQRLHLEGADPERTLYQQR